MHRILDQYRRQILLRVVAGAAGLFLLAWGVIPLYTSRFHIGCLVLMLAGLLLLGAALLYPALARGIRRLWKRRAGRITLSGIGAVSYTHLVPAAGRAEKPRADTMTGNG